MFSKSVMVVSFVVEEYISQKEMVNSSNDNNKAITTISERLLLPCPLQSCSPHPLFPPPYATRELFSLRDLP